jgi:hypothetical protein
MKKIFLNYETPEVEIVEVNIEKGFAASSETDAEKGDGTELPGIDQL